MSAESSSVPLSAKPKAPKAASAFFRILQYSLIRLLTLFITVVIGIYLTILIANMGGYVDKIRMGQIREDVNQRVATNPANRGLSIEARQNLINESIALESHRLGMDRPFIQRSLDFLKDAITLNLGRAQNMTSNSGSGSVRLIILERLPATLILFGASDIILFVVALVFALMLSRAYGSFFDKLSVALTPLSSAPAAPPRRRTCNRWRYSAR